MSNRYKGAIISATPPTTTGGESGTASGAWTLEQQMQLTAAGLWPIQPLPPFIEDVFSCFLYTGTGASNAITNGIDLSTKGGLVWIKQRNAVIEHFLYDTTRGVTKSLSSNDTTSEYTNVNTLTAFGTSGFTLGSSNFVNGITSAPRNYVSWTFREQAKFFDIVTYTGTGAVQNIAHNLGSVPGCIIIKAFAGTSSGTRYWAVYHRSNGETKYQELNSTNSAFTNANYWDNTAPTSTQFTIGSAADLNASGNTFVAYLFAHDAGGFGLTGTDNVISCGSFTTDGSGNATVSLGYEPQWVLWKRSDSSTGGNWRIVDAMRGMAYASQGDNSLYPNLTDIEDGGNVLNPTATGFIVQNGTTFGSANYIYIAIRRGPMKVPTLGTSVFTPSTRAGTGATATTSNLSFPPDMVWSKGRDNGGTNSGDFDRLRGATNQLSLNQSDAETTASTSLTGFDVMTGYTAGSDAVQLTINATGYNYVNWQFRRAPGFFDEICWTATGSAQTLNHNLNAVPELMIRKRRDLSTGGQWDVYVAPLGATNKLILNQTAAVDGNSAWNNTTPTSSVVYMNNTVAGWTFVTYLFATCAGVSKVGSYAGTGATQTIDCGFGAGGARFVLIKRTDSTGDWYVWDTARGMVSGTDPSLLLNNTNAEVNANSIYTATTGFQIVSTAAGINSSAIGATYIFLAIA